MALLNSEAPMWFMFAMIAAITWGLNYSLDEKILQHNISPYLLLILQATTGLLVYAIIFIGVNFSSLKHSLSLVVKNKVNLGLLAAAAICSVIANIFICLSIKEKNATVAGIIELIYPLFTVLFTYLLFKQLHLTWGVVLGGVLIFIGVVLISVVN